MKTINVNSLEFKEGMYCGEENIKKKVLRLIDKKIWLLNKSLEKCKDKDNLDYDEIQIPIYDGKKHLLEQLKKELTCLSQEKLE